MSKANKQSPFRQGAIGGLIFLPVLAPFSLLFGIFASDLDLTILQTLGFSFSIFAGASQFASLSLLNDGAPILIAILAGFTLNIRFFLYSATLAPHFQGLKLKIRAFLAYLIVDQSFVLSDNRFSEVDWTASQKAQYFLGIMAIVAMPWHFFTFLGFYTGALIPDHINISFALPLSFIALIMPAITSRPHLAAALISIIGALLLRHIPYNLGLLISAFFAILIAAWLEKRIKEAS